MLKRQQRPSSTSLDEDPSSIALSRRFSRPILHLKGTALTIVSSIAATPFPQRRLNLLHRNRNILTDSLNEVEAYLVPPKRLYTHCSHFLLNSTSRRRWCFIPHPHGAATLKPAPRATSPRQLSPSARPLRWRRPYQPDLLLMRRLSLARSRCCCCSGSRLIARSPRCCYCSPPRSCCCSALISLHFS